MVVLTIDAVTFTLKCKDIMILNTFARLVTQLAYLILPGTNIIRLTMANETAY